MLTLDRYEENGAANCPEFQGFHGCSGKRPGRECGMVPTHVESAVKQSSQSWLPKSGLQLLIPAPEVENPA